MKEHKFSCESRHHATPSDCDCGYGDKYWRLLIRTIGKSEYLWIADMEGNLVVKEKAKVDIRLLPGCYTYQLSLGGDKEKIILNKDVEIIIDDAEYHRKKYEEHVKLRQKKYKELHDQIDTQEGGDI